MTPGAPPMPDRPGGAVAGLVLAAGESTRMGQPKPLLRWGPRTLLQHQIDALTRAGCQPVVVVLGHEAAAIRAHLTGTAPCQIVENPEYRQGRAESVRAGIRAIPAGAEAVVIINVDQPCRADTVRALIAARRRTGALIAVPTHQGKAGHPAIFAGGLREELLHVSEAGEGLRAVRAAHARETLMVAMDDPQITLDLNTPDAYTAAERRYAPARPPGREADPPPPSDAPP